MDRRIAEAFTGETGTNMTKFATAGHLASSAGMCHGQHESAGKSKKLTSRKDDGPLRRHLVVATMAATRAKGTTWPPITAALRPEGARCVPTRPSDTLSS